jgi:hypothetical protein
MKSTTTFFTLVEVEVTQEDGELLDYEFVDDESIHKEATKYARKLWDMEKEQEQNSQENLTL